MPRLLAILIVPVALAVMVPLTLVFGVVFYINVLVRAIIHLAAFVIQRNAVLAEPLQQPHFLETRTPTVTPK
jgi:hypothetical protein